MKKAICLILLLLMLIPAVASCAKNGGGEQKPDGTAPVETAGESKTASIETQPEDDNILDYVKDIADGVDFNGMTFTFIGRDNETGGNFPKEEKETGDIESDAIYFRQRDIEQLFGIDMEYVKTENGEIAGDQVINEVTAGGDSYDLVHGSTQTTGQMLLNSSVIKPVDDLKYVNLDNEWWVQSLRDDYSISFRLYFLTGPIVTDNYRDANCVLFNKNVTSMFSISDDELYQCVRDGKWTLDRMFEIASAVPENVSGTGVWRYCEPSGYNFILTSGLKITKFDEEGSPYVESDLPIEISNLADKLCPIFSDPTQTAFFNYKVDESLEKKFGVEKMLDIFIDDKALFKFGYTETAMELRKYDVPFGILPMPKGTDSQKDYCSYARMGHDSAVYIPRSVRNIDFCDAITEAMGALSEKYVKDAYYEKLLKSQSVFDLESRDMIDIIFRTKVYDLIALYSGADFNQMGSFLQALDDAFNLDNSELASKYKSNSKLVNIYAKQLVKAVNKID